MAKCKAVPMGKRAFRLVDEENKRAYGFTHIILKDEKLIAIK